MGFVAFVLQQGKVEGDFVLISDAMEDGIRKQFSPAQFPIAQLNTDAERLPKGFAEFIHAHGRINDEVLELDLDALDELHEKFPVPVYTKPKEPTLAEMTANFTEAVAGWAKAGFKVVEKGVFEKRHTICRSCEFWLPDARLGIGKCRKCGCSIYKLWMATSKCPLTPPKWERV